MSFDPHNHSSSRFSEKKSAVACGGFNYSGDQGFQTAGLLEHNEDPALALDEHQRSFSYDDRDDQIAHHNIDEGSEAYQEGGYHLTVINELFNHRYQTLRKIGYGHFSVVWLVRDILAQEPTFYAMKIVKSNANYREQAQDEYFMLCDIQRKLAEYSDSGLDNVVRVYDSFEHNAGGATHFCIVMELLGHSLYKLLTRYAPRISTSKAIPIAIVKVIARNLLKGLACIHGTGYIHTDVKLENLAMKYNLHDIRSLNTPVYDCKLSTSAFTPRMCDFKRLKQKNQEALFLFAQSLANLDGVYDAERILNEYIDNRSYVCNIRPNSDPTTDEALVNSINSFDIEGMMRRADEIFRVVRSGESILEAFRNRRSIVQLTDAQSLRSFLGQEASETNPDSTHLSLESKVLGRLYVRGIDSFDQLTSSGSCLNANCATICPPSTTAAPLVQQACDDSKCKAVITKLNTVLEGSLEIDTEQCSTSSNFNNNNTSSTMTLVDEESRGFGSAPVSTNFDQCIPSSTSRHYLDQLSSDHASSGMSTLPKYIDLYSARFIVGLMTHPALMAGASGNMPTSAPDTLRCEQTKCSLDAKSLMVRSRTNSAAVTELSVNANMFGSYSIRDCQVTSLAASLADESVRSSNRPHVVGSPLLSERCANHNSNDHSDQAQQSPKKLACPSDLQPKPQYLTYPVLSSVSEASFVSHSCHNLTACPKDGTSAALNFEPLCRIPLRNNLHALIENTRQTENVSESVSRISKNFFHSSLYLIDCMERGTASPDKRYSSGLVEPKGEEGSASSTQNHLNVFGNYNIKNSMQAYTFQIGTPSKSFQALTSSPYNRSPYGYDFARFAESRCGALVMRSSDPPDVAHDSLDIIFPTLVSYFDTKHLIPLVPEMFAVKIVDLGNACPFQHHYSELIQTRQYRSPEVILGIPYDQTTDVWSAACVIMELLTGTYLFNPLHPEEGDSWSRDESHLAQIIGTLGYNSVSIDYLLSGKHSSQFFDTEGRLRHIHGLSCSSLYDLLVREYKFREADAQEIAEFLTPMLEINHTKRATAAEALKSKWLNAPGPSDSFFGYGGRKTRPKA